MSHGDPERVAVDGFCSLPEAIHAANGDTAYNDCPAGSGSDLIDFDLPTSTTRFYANARVVRSTFFDNHDASAGGSGGAISIVNSDLTVESSTLTGNRANNNGGGIGAFMNNIFALAIRVNVIDSTITANQSEANGGTVGDGGGIFMQASADDQVWLKLQNSVVAGNLDSGTANQPDLSCGSGSMMSIGGSSFVGSNEGCEVYFEAGTPNAAGNFVGTNAFPLDPLLQPLAFHGGTTPVHHPEYDPASPLIDQGACSGEIIDQRLQGNPSTSLRPVDVPGVPGSPGGDDCDIGAVEVFAELNTDPRVFLDDFESSTTLFWASQ